MRYTIDTLHGIVECAGLHAISVVSADGLSKTNRLNILDDSVLEFALKVFLKEMTQVFALRS